MQKFVLLFVLLVAVLGGLYAVLSYLVDRSQPSASLPIPARDPIEREKINKSAPPTPASRKSTAAPPQAPPPPQTTSPVPVPVNSYDPILAYRVDLWTLQSYKVGHVDSIRIRAPCD